MGLGRGCSNGSIHDNDSSMSCRGDCSEGASCTCRAANHDLVVGGDDDDDGNEGGGRGAGHGGVGEGGGVRRVAAGGSESTLSSHRNNLNVFHRKSAARRVTWL